MSPHKENDLNISPFPPQDTIDFSCLSPLWVFKYFTLPVPRTHMAITQPWTPPSMEEEGKVTRWRMPGRSKVLNKNKNENRMQEY